ncbi:MAG: hypothetical protein WCL02_02240 [bacterium]
MQTSIQYLKNLYYTYTLPLKRFTFSDLKTSTQISLKFTLFTMIQVLLFSILANAIFFQNWYTRQEGLIPLTTTPQ